MYVDVACSEIKDLKGKQAKQSVETVKQLMADKAIRKGEKERSVPWISMLTCAFTEMF